MTKTKIELRPLKDTKNDYNFNVEFEIEGGEISMCAYDGDTGEYRTITFKIGDFQKLNNIIEATK